MEWEEISAGKGIASRCHGTQAIPADGTYPAARLHDGGAAPPTHTGSTNSQLPSSRIGKCDFLNQVIRPFMIVILSKLRKDKPPTPSW